MRAIVLLGLRIFSLALLVLGFVGFVLWLASRYLPPASPPVRRAVQVFVRNDTLWVCDAGCLYVEPRRRGCR